MAPLNKIARTCPQNQWFADHFHEHLNDVVKSERKDGIPLKMTDDEIKASVLGQFARTKSPGPWISFGSTPRLSKIGIISI